MSKKANIIKQWDQKSGVDIAVVGIPFDWGVNLSGGRVGASEAPEAIRREFEKYGSMQNVEDDTDYSCLNMADFGDILVVPENSLETHNSIIESTKKIIQNSEVLIILGGGHDISYATTRALSEQCEKNIGGINIDAHFDVRPVVDGIISSGTPYRRLIEEEYLKGENFLEISSQGQVNTKEHYNWLKEKKVDVYFLSEIRSVGVGEIFKKVEKKLEKVGSLFVSVDIDAIAQSFAPGSSAPSPDGLFPEDILKLAYMAGKNHKVKLFEIMEVNPRYDVDNRTSRLAVNIINNFLSGYCKRK